MFVRKRGGVVCQALSNLICLLRAVVPFSLRSFRGTCLSVGVWRHFFIIFCGYVLILRSILFSSMYILIYSVIFLSFICDSARGSLPLEGSVAIESA